MFLCETDLTSTEFYDTLIITYEIEIPAAVKKIDFNLLDYKDLTILYIVDKIPNSPDVNKLPI